MGFGIFPYIRQCFWLFRKARNSFTDILSDNQGEVQGALGDGVEKLDEIINPFTDVND